jgi:hypothetical protein
MQAAMTNPNVLAPPGRPRRPRRSWNSLPGLILGALLSALTVAAAPAVSTIPAGPASLDENAATPTPVRPDPPTAAQIGQAIARGLAFLYENQNPDGSWGSARRTKDLNIYAPVPGAHHAFRSGVTALCVSALAETKAADADPGDPGRRAFDRGADWLLENLPHLRRADTIAIYNVWGHAYGIQALAHLHRRAAADPARRERIREILASQTDRLRRYESVDGGWGYYDFKAGTQRPASDSTSFVTATVLVAFDEARDVGVPFPPDVLRRAVASIERQRKNDHSYAYAEDLRMRPMRLINRPAGSLGRSQACNLALRLWGDTNVTDAVVTRWLDRLVDRNGWLSVGRKRPVPHESWFQVAGYFYYYGHFYAARCARLLPPDEAGRFQGQLAAILLPLQEKDGSWWDYPLYDYHQPYGTAFALMSLPAPNAPPSPMTPAR